jgi:hypothetical protein
MDLEIESQDTDLDSDCLASSVWQPNGSTSLCDVPRNLKTWGGGGKVSQDWNLCDMAELRFSSPPNYCPDFCFPMSRACSSRWRWVHFYKNHAGKNHASFLHGAKRKTQKQILNWNTGKCPFSDSGFVWAQELR